MIKIFISVILAFTFSVAQAEITAKSWLVTDDQNHIIAEKNAWRTQSIASITKLMTAIVVLKSGQELEEVIPLDYKYSRKYHTTLPRTVKQLTRHQLIDLAIVKSDNFAAYTLCDQYPGGVTACVEEMNQEAQRLEMTHSQFVDPTGLDENNVSTAYDLARLVIEASTHEHITESSSKSKVSIKVKKRWWEFKNTNPLVHTSDNIRVSKTGYIHRSGGCIAMMIETEYGPRVIVLLGSKNTRTRIPEAEQIRLTLTSKDITVE
jgi:serine-type D-Ala-D-Ala endopeptidase (penicillin-binding protein 7)